MMTRLITSDNPNTPMKYYLADMTWEEVQERSAKGEIAIIPTGSTEQHGRHLPLKTDIFIASEITRRAVEKVWPRAKPVITPPVHFGYSPEHTYFPGTITVGYRVFVDLLKDICVSLYRHGFKKLVFFNGHGGNTMGGVLATAMVEAKKETDAFIAMASWWELCSKALAEVLETPPNHACEMETSVMLALGVPVDMKKAEGRLPPAPIKGFSQYGLTSEGFGVLNTEFWGVFSRVPSGAIGEPKRASAKKGRIIVNEAVNNFARMILELEKKPYTEEFGLYAKRRKK